MNVFTVMPQGNRSTKIKMMHPAAELVRSRDGSECVYKEGRYICLARVQSTSVDARGVQAEMRPVPYPVTIAPTKPWTVYSIWDSFCCRGDTWRCAGSGLIWHVFFSGAIILKFKEVSRLVFRRTS